ncbi:MAG: ATP-binding cassette domain-containing protein, partial [Clostridiales bacterium]|nr:ATP-binding cassette domain-containing protein [Clostridiales bacterium]
MGIICSLKNVSKSYGTHRIFENMSLEIEEGEMVCITGKSGSGKSTLLNLIGMFDRADSGEIRLFGEPLPGISSRAGRALMRDRLFYCFQNFALVDGETVGYNLDIPLIGKHFGKKEKTARKLDALSRVGLDKPLDEKIFRLSGGEQQRVAIARAFLRSFDIILADEPTGSLDGENRDRVLDIFSSFNGEGKTVI